MAVTIRWSRCALAGAALSALLVGCSSSGGTEGVDVDQAPAVSSDVASGELTLAAAPAGETAVPPTDVGVATGSEGTDQASPGSPSSSQVAASPPASAGAGEILALEPSTHPLKGSPAPDLTMTALSTGEPVSLADFAGRPVVVNWWATWCLPCRVEMPWLQAARDANADRGLEVLLVDAGEKVPPTLAATHIGRFVDSIGLTLPVLYGENTYDIQEDWTVGALPVTFLVTPDGMVADVRSGGYPNQATLEDHIQRLLLTDE